MVICLILKSFARLLSRLFTKSFPQSVRIARGQPNLAISLWAKASDTSEARLLGIGTPTHSFVSWSCTVRTYLLPLGVVGRGPTRSKDTLSKASIGICYYHWLACFNTDQLLRLTALTGTYKVLYVPSHVWLCGKSSWLPCDLLSGLNGIPELCFFFPPVEVSEPHRNR